MSDTTKPNWVPHYWYTDILFETQVDMNAEPGSDKACRYRVLSHTGETPHEWADGLPPVPTTDERPAHNDFDVEVPTWWQRIFLGFKDGGLVNGISK